MALTKVTSGLTDLDGGITIDNITIDGTEIDLSSGDLTIDVAGDIILDADGADVKFFDDGTQVGQIEMATASFNIRSMVSDADLLFKGNDGGSTITALTLDMSAEGRATFNGDLIVPRYIEHTGDSDTFIGFPSDDTFVINTGGSERMRIDSSGNVGIGSSPVSTLRNDVHSTEKGLQVGRAAMLFADSGVTTDLQNNSHLNNDDNRVAMTGTLGGSFYQQYGGIHAFYTAPAVAAPNTQTHTLRFRIALDGTLAGTSTSISSLSDERAKKNIEDYTGGLNLIKSLRPRTFEFKDTTGVRKTGTQKGFIAQEILEQDSYWVTEEDASDTKDAEYEYTKDTEKRYLTILNDKDAVFVSAIKELIAKVEELESKINE